MSSSACVLVTGPPGSGKSTFCAAVREMAKAVGRDAHVVNLDFAADATPYEAAVDVRELASLGEAMEVTGLGPNGGLVYCMELLVENLDWLEERMAPLRGAFVLVDMPGQVELFTHHAGLRAVLAAMRRWRLNLACANLVDAYLCADADKYVAALLLSLSVMVSLELPHVNVLSKVDLAERHGTLAYGLEFYTGAGGLEALLERRRDELAESVAADDPAARRHLRLTEAIAGVVDDYSLVAFMPLSVLDRESLAAVLDAIDRAAGYVAAGPEREAREAMRYAVGRAADPAAVSAALEGRFLGGGGGGGGGGGE